jgi:hypothetical protein
MLTYADVCRRRRPLAPQAREAALQHAREEEEEQFAREQALQEVRAQALQLATHLTTNKHQAAFTSC